MGVIKRQSIKTMLVSYMGVLIGMFNLLWLYPKYLDKAEIGLIYGLVDAAGLCLPLVLLGIPAVSVRYFPYFDNREKRHYGFLSLLILVPLLAFLLLLPLFYAQSDRLAALFSGKSPLFAGYLSYLPLLCFFLVFFNLFEAYSRSFHRIVAANLLREFFLRIGTSVVVAIYALQWVGLDGFMALYVALYGIALVLLIMYVVQQKQMLLGPIDPKVFNKPMRREILLFALFIFAGNLGGTIVYKIDSIMINALIGESDNGVFKIASFIGLVVEMPRRAVTQIAGSVVAGYFKNNETNRIEDLYKRVSTNQFAAGMLFLICIWANVGNIFALMPNGNLYVSGSNIILFVGMAKVFDMVTSINEEIMAYSPYYRYAPLALFFLVGLTIVTNLTLIPIWGITGVAIANALCILLYNILKFLLIYFKMGIQPFSKSTLKIMVISAIVLTINYFMPFMYSVFVDVVLRTILMGGLFTVATLVWRVSPDLNNIINDKIFK